MRYPYLIGGILVLGVGVWWLLGDDPEARVREAHAELAQYLYKSEEESDDGLSVLALRSLETLFAATCSISGDADGLAASYTASELVGVIVRARGAMAAMELRFGEITIEFPQEETAVARFSASLEGMDVEGERHSEARQVESRMRDFDGVWQFVSFTLTEP
jgi:hypothetical protein